MTVRAVSTVVASILAFSTFASGRAFGDEPETRRDQVVHAVDADGDSRLDGHEMKTLKKSYPRLYENLREFCDAAKEHPKANGVDLPLDPSRKQKQCKKRHVAAPYLTAWAALGKPLGPDSADKVHEDRVQDQRGHAVP